MCLEHGEDGYRALEVEKAEVAVAEHVRTEEPLTQIRDLAGKL